MITLEEVKEYLRIDYDEPSLTMYIDVAENYIKDSIDNYETKKNNASFKSKAKLLSLMLINEMYSNREIISDKQEKYKTISNAIMLQMQYNSFD